MGAWARGPGLVGAQRAPDLVAQARGPVGPGWSVLSGLLIWLPRIVAQARGPVVPWARGPGLVGAQRAPDLVGQARGPVGPWAVGPGWSVLIWIWIWLVRLVGP